MPAPWQRCPHCNVYSLPGKKSEPTQCPACGQSLTAGAAAPPAPVPGSSSSPSAACAFDTRHEVLSEAQVVPEAANCVQCGMCSYNCPMGIDVRAHAWRGLAIH